MTTSTKVHTFEVEFKDGDVLELESHGFPWIYREWLVVATPDGRKDYYPQSNVVRWSEI